MENILDNNPKTIELLNKYHTYTSIQQGYQIPNIVHYSFKSWNLTDDYYKHIERNKQICSNCEFIFYNNQDQDNFINTYFNQRIINAYYHINSCYGAMKCDFFRYCVLYVMGGIYIDIKSAFKVPIFRLIQKKDVCLLDILRQGEPWRKYHPTHEQWCLMFAPQHPYLLSMIQLMVSYIERQYIPRIRNYHLSTKDKILNLTGPDAFTRAIYRVVKKKQAAYHRIINYDHYFIYNNIGDYQKIYKLNNIVHYSQLREPLYI